MTKMTQVIAYLPLFQIKLKYFLDIFLPSNIPITNGIFFHPPTHSNFMVIMKIILSPKNKCVTQNIAASFVSYQKNNKRCSN